MEEKVRITDAFTGEIDGVEYYDVSARVYAMQDVSSNAKNTIDEA